MESAFFEAKMLTVLRENRAGRWVGGQDSGRLDPRSLYRSPFSDRVFRQKLATSTREYWLSILVDCSGSMSGEALRNAISAAAQMAASCDKVGINTEIIMFCSYPAVVKQFGMKVAKGKMEETMKWYLSEGREKNRLMTMQPKYGEGPELYLFDSEPDLSHCRGYAQRHSEYRRPARLFYEKTFGRAIGEDRVGEQRGGTKIGLAYKQALDSLDTKSGGKFVCIFTDGEEDSANSGMYYADVHGMEPQDLTKIAVPLSSLTLRELYKKSQDEIQLLGVGIGCDTLSRITSREDCVNVECDFRPGEIYNGILRIMRRKILG